MPLSSKRSLRLFAKTSNRLLGPFNCEKHFDWNRIQNQQAFKEASLGLESAKLVDILTASNMQVVYKKAIAEMVGSSSSTTNPLNQIFLSHNCNKGTEHNYPSLYCLLLEGFRENIKLFVEIGIGSPFQDGDSRMANGYAYGSSLRGWRDFFPAAQIVGCDIDPRVLIEEERISSFYVDQLNPSSLACFSDWIISKKGADIILDDGLHDHVSNTASFLLLWRALKPGGLYIIEDMKKDRFRKNLDYLTKLNINAVCYGIELFSMFKNDNRVMIIGKKPAGLL